jgi:hypothetical protein
VTLEEGERVYVSNVPLSILLIESQEIPTKLSSFVPRFSSLLLSYYGENGEDSVSIIAIGSPTLHIS